MPKTPSQNTALVRRMTQIKLSGDTLILVILLPHHQLLHLYLPLLLILHPALQVFGITLFIRLILSRILLNPSKTPPSHFHTSLYTTPFSPPQLLCDA